MFIHLTGLIKTHQGAEMSLVDTIQKEFEKAESKGWTKIFVFVDLHECILKPDWEITDLAHDYYPEAKEMLQELSERDDICLVVWTCSHPFEITEYLINFEADDIHFDYVNENPEVRTDNRGHSNTERPKYGCYDKKPYYNVLLDDKAGCTPNEIPKIRAEFKKYSLLNET